MGRAEATILPSNINTSLWALRGPEGSHPFGLPQPCCLPGVAQEEVLAAAPTLQAWAGKVGCCAVELGRLPLSSDQTSPRSPSPGKRAPVLKPQKKENAGSPGTWAGNTRVQTQRPSPWRLSPNTPRRQSPRPFPPRAQLPGARGFQMGGPRSEGPGGKGKRGEE